MKTKGNSKTTASKYINKQTNNIASVIILIKTKNDLYFYQENLVSVKHFL